MKLIICVLGLCALAAAQDNFKECLDKDSISCVQMMVRKKRFGLLKVKRTVQDTWKWNKLEHQLNWITKLLGRTQTKKNSYANSAIMKSEKLSITNQFPPMVNQSRSMVIMIRSQSKCFANYASICADVPEVVVGWGPAHHQRAELVLIKC